ncbi:hypothetical protein DFA_01053 [Cavenderia fasciculata]|uniref:BRCT domain-containing protein n=1 Tax=Cavenderia fasciculata TaxID=261658 RepID=F4PQL1_CACFS|nr:uncharacterized protein DFA_01053 [Cavenderia fasciculata]EGG21178.1 hypothetical protein DFA_01053 [Cavenderia fasciculata]|eukprot:XP_004359028.1 hypothetical protein DFA_01053 [Cavenderia fasciculata]
MIQQFLSFHFYIHPNINKEYKRCKVEQVIRHLGGTIYYEFRSDTITHVIASNDTDLVNDIPKEILKLNTLQKIVIIRKKWLMDCLTYQRVLPVEYYLLDPKYMIMKGCRLAVYQLPKDQQLKVRAWIELHGGKYIQSFEQRCTHVLVKRGDNDLKSFPRGEFDFNRNIKFVSVDWFDQCVSRGLFVSERPYLLQLPPSSPTLFQGHLFYVSNHFGIDSQLAIQQKIQSFGGTLVDSNGNNMIGPTTTLSGMVSPSPESGSKNQSDPHYITISQQQPSISSTLALMRPSIAVSTDWISDCIEKNKVINIYEEILYRPIRVIKDQEKQLGSKYHFAKQTHVASSSSYINTNNYNGGIPSEKGIQIITKQWLEVPTQHQIYILFYYMSLLYQSASKH